MRTSSGPASHCVRIRDNPAQSDGSGPTAARKAFRTYVTTTEVRAAVEAPGHSSHQLPGRKLTGHRSEWSEMPRDSSAIPSLGLRLAKARQHRRVNDGRPRFLRRRNRLLLHIECRQKKLQKRFVRERVLT